ncbi:MAG: 6-pyruvoyl tetrahydropterin synthase [Parcubacteria group bacterium ADurb.Bin216]|nr:MAG: 6-pyruvoyl tetrahydropterin synthase [Parcubacteria group bacterium ADurb.Bin216]OQB02225.1 MAG: 6-pyruvoyl tetrahydropterin synthase [Parcubacteria group bacterium ADurb.Bin216]
MKTYISKIINIGVCYRLLNLPKSHPYCKLFKQNLTLTLNFCGPQKEDKEWIIDYAKLDEMEEVILEDFNHRCLNMNELMYEKSDIEVNATLENMAQYFYHYITKKFPGYAELLDSVELDNNEGLVATVIRDEEKRLEEEIPTIKTTDYYPYITYPPFFYRPWYWNEKL